MKGLILILMVLLIASCDVITAPDNLDMTIENYFPLAVGNMWIYREDGELDTIRIDDSFQWDGITVYRVYGKYSYNYYNYDNGKLYYWIDELPADSGFYWNDLSEPLNTGAYWKWNSRDDYELVITTINMPMTVEAGYFENCIKIQVKDDPHWHYLYWIYAPDVGLIETNNKELIEYEVK